jgi:hypothetical protein
MIVIAVLARATGARQKKCRFPARLASVRTSQAKHLLVDRQTAHRLEIPRVW